MSAVESSTPVNPLDDVRPNGRSAKVVRQSLSIGVTAVVKDALERHYGSLKAAAISLHMDQGQLSRELGSGDFKLEKLERADDEAKAFVAAALHEAFGDVDPAARVRRIIRNVRKELDELAEAVNG